MRLITSHAVTHQQKPKPDTDTTNAKLHKKITWGAGEETMKKW